MQFVQIEAIISSVLDEYTHLRKYKAIVTFSTCLLMFGVSNLFITQVIIWILQHVCRSDNVIDFPNFITGRNLFVAIVWLVCGIDFSDINLLMWNHHCRMDLRRWEFHSWYWIYDWIFGWDMVALMLEIYNTNYSQCMLLSNSWDENSICNEYCSPFFILNSSSFSWLRFYSTPILRTMEWHTRSGWLQLAGRAVYHQWFAFRYILFISYPERMGPWRR